MLKSKENEYNRARDELIKNLKGKERQLSTNMKAINSFRNQSENIKKQKFST